MDGDKLACDSVYYALFRVVEIGELENAEAAVKWAEEALSVSDLRSGIVEGVKERVADREPAGVGRFSRG